MVSLVALSVHGVVDAGFYGSKVAVIFFVPLGMAFGLAEPGVPASSSGRAAATLGVALLVLAALLLPGVRAAFQANLGAVLQARAELPALGGPDVRIQDAVRRSPAVNLVPAEARLPLRSGAGPCQRHGQPAPGPDHVVAGGVRRSARNTWKPLTAPQKGSGRRGFCWGRATPPQATWRVRRGSGRGSKGLM